MSQEMMHNGSGNGTAESIEPGVHGRRDLTYDQKKAAEAAFRGEPFNPAWSVARKSML